MKSVRIGSWIVKILALASVACLPAAKASPYASDVTVSNGTVSFILNEGGGDVTVTYEDGSTNANYNGITTGTNMAVGMHSFALNGHTGYAISVLKIGTGIPTQISDDSSNFAIWNTPRGMAVNQNPKIGKLFGRIYAGNGGVGGSGASAKYHGLYAMNADLSDALGQGTNAFAQGRFGSESGSAPYKMRVAPDDSLLVGDYAGNGGLYLFTPDLSKSNAIFLPTQPAGIHGDMVGTPDLLMTNIEGTNYLTLWVFDSGMGVPSAAQAPDLVLGPGTARGDYNCAYRYDIGTYNTWPYDKPPNYAYTVGLSGIAELRIEGDIGKDGKIICGFERINLSNPDVQILDPTGTSLLWTSWNDTAGASDPWSGLIPVGSDVGGTYGGIRVSPDGRFLAAVDRLNGITIASLTNGIPDDSSLFGIQNAPNVGNSRGMDWDAADNLYVISSGQGLLRVWSLGNTATCVTSNDITGTNGTFQLILPQVSATVVTAQNGSQNYVNNAPPGTPVPGIFNIALSTNNLSQPITVGFTRAGSAVYGTNYTMNLGTDANGVVIGTNSVTFPAGAYSGAGNWQANVQIIPTATPVSGPTLGVTVGLRGGAQSTVGTPGTASLVISNTGPQLLVLSPASSGTTMSRAVANDYAGFVITRWGDLNGPGNSPGNVNAVSYTVTNFTYLGTAAFPADYTARAQNFTGSSPIDGSPGITINPGDVTITNIIGNPVPHANLNQTPVDVTITISLTNAATGTNATSSEGYAYSVTPGSVTLTELDNAVGHEVVLWSDPLTNSLDSTNWTLTYAATNMAAHPVLPVVIPNYTNDESAITSGGTNDFRVEFGTPVSNDSVPQSATMAANGWTTALRMTVNKDGSGAQTAVNLYPQRRTFAGNYALRFSMYLSLYGGAIGNPYAGTYPREFALFGVNHAGTNCNWRTASTIGSNPGYAAPTNADGVWFAIDAASGSVSPADFDAFTSPALPNSGVPADYVSQNSQQNNGIFKSPPFVNDGIIPPLNQAGGEPVNQWVNVSVEVTGQTNVTVYMNRSPVLPTFNLLNGGGDYTSGKVMLGYLDPVPDVGDPSSQFVYYSDVRVVELSPYISTNTLPAGVIAVQGANVSFAASATYATAPITNTWYMANATPVPVTAVQTDTAPATNFTSTLSLNNVQFGTNYVPVFSDAAGSVTGAVASLEVIIGPANAAANAGATVHFSVAASGPSAPTSYRWMLNGTNLANNAHYAGVTTAVLTITNVQAADAGTYSVAVANAAGTVTPSAMLTLAGPSVFSSSVSMAGTNLDLSFSTTDLSATTGSFLLLSAPAVTGPYTTNGAAMFTGGGGSFQVTVPQTTNNSMFYRLQYNP